MNYCKNIGSKTKLDKLQNNVIIHSMKKYYRILTVYLFVMFLIGVVVFAGIILMSGEDVAFECIERGGHYDTTTEQCIKK